MKITAPPQTLDKVSYNNKNRVYFLSIFAGHYTTLFFYYPQAVAGL